MQMGRGSVEGGVWRREGDVADPTAGLVVDPGERVIDDLRRCVGRRWPRIEIQGWQKKSVETDSC